MGTILRTAFLSEEIVREWYWSGDASAPGFRRDPAPLWFWIPSLFSLFFGSVTGPLATNRMGIYGGCALMMICLLKKNPLRKKEISVIRVQLTVILEGTKMFLCPGQEKMIILFYGYTISDSFVPLTYVPAYSASIRSGSRFPNIAGWRIFAVYARPMYARGPYSTSLANA